MGRKIYDWAEVQRFVDEGHGFVEAQRRFGFSHTAWIKAIQRENLRVGDRPFKDRRRRYDWAVVQAYYDEGHLYENASRASASRLTLGPTRFDGANYKHALGRCRSIA